VYELFRSFIFDIRTRLYALFFCSFSLCRFHSIAATHFTYFKTCYMLSRHRATFYSSRKKKRQGEEKKKRNFIHLFLFSFFERPFYIITAMTLYSFRLRQYTSPVFTLHQQRKLRWTSVQYTINRLYLTTTLMYKDYSYILMFE
jgi:hypothetical protein